MLMNVKRTIIHTCIHNRITEDETSVSKHVEDIKKLIKN